ncbi:MAG: PilZ domain-containing protein [Deltaproteobacteria bacterium]|nr:PilZ domain-containing protein [Deltaproteobacteria bacterium]
MSTRDPLPRRALVSYAASDAFAPTTLLLLARLGYTIHEPEGFAKLADPDDRPDAFLVDERRLAEVPDDGGPQIPIVALAGRQGVTGADVRVAGAVPRPAGLHELFSVLQQVLERRPRSAPRVATHLSARCCAEDSGAWQGTLLTLSENGCLLRSPEPLLLGSKLCMHFALPRGGEIELDAEVAYQLPPDLGLVFSSVEAAARRAIADFVGEALASL